jgi:hypothetical protein
MTGRHRSTRHRRRRFAPWRRRAFLLGGADQAKVADAMRRIRQRMNPEAPTELLKVADQVLRQYVRNATWVSAEIRDEVMRAVG